MVPIQGVNSPSLRAFQGAGECIYIKHTVYVVCINTVFALYTSLFYCIYQSFQAFMNHPFMFVFMAYLAYLAKVVEKQDKAKHWNQHIIGRCWRHRMIGSTSTGVETLQVKHDKSWVKLIPLFTSLKKNCQTKIEARFWDWIASTKLLYLR